MRPELIQENISLAPHTSLRLGGPARFFCRVRSVAELRECLTWAASHQYPVHVLGGGSNTVFSDRGFPGLVVHMALSGLLFDTSADTVWVTAAAGESWSRLVDACVARGLGGIECLAGIPGLVGAAPIQNVGAYGQEVADVLTRVRVLDRSSLRERDIAASDCGLGYRRSRFKTTDQGRFVLISATCRLVRNGRPRLRYPELAGRVAQMVELEALEDGADALGAVRDSVLGLRRGKSMVVDPGDPESRSVGSFFLNPVLDARGLAALRARLADGDGPPCFRALGGTKVSAAWLIERAGFPRGFSREGVAVSAHHALSLVNHEGSSTALLALAADIQAAVQRKYGILLEREPVVVPDGGVEAP